MRFNIIDWSSQPIKSQPTLCTRVSNTELNSYIIIIAILINFVRLSNSDTNKYTKNMMSAASSVPESTSDTFSAYTMIVSILSLHKHQPRYKRHSYNGKPIHKKDMSKCMS